MKKIRQVQRPNSKVIKKLGGNFATDRECRTLLSFSTQ